jgi:hypothetical protein
VIDEGWLALDDPLFEPWRHGRFADASPSR